MQTLWYEYRMRETKRAPKRAIPRGWVVARGYGAWFLNIGAAAARAWISSMDLLGSSCPHS